MRIALDMDGLFTDLEKKIKIFCGVESGFEFTTFRYFNQIYDTLILAEEKRIEFYGHIMNRYGWGSLELTEYAYDIMSWARKNFDDVFFLTALPPINKLEATIGKIEWAKSYFKHVSVIAVEDKSIYAGPDVFLLDDRADNCANFIKAGGRSKLWPLSANKISRNLYPHLEVFDKKELYSQ